MCMLPADRSLLIFPSYMIHTLLNDEPTRPLCVSVCVCAL